MTSTDIDTARENLTAAEAEVDRLRSQLRAALADQASRGESASDAPRRLGWADGVAAARARYPQGEGTGDAPRAAPDEADEARPTTSAAEGREEARRRAARRA
jgi:hypothetical protein